LQRRHTRIGVAGGEKHGGITCAGLHFLIWRVSIKKLELRGIRRVPILEKRGWVIILEPVITNHIEIWKFTEDRGEKLGSLRECRTYE
jgi:hypothetical protein